MNLISYNWIEIAIILFIIGSIAITVWRTGQSNPTGTGEIGKRIHRLDTDVRAVKTQVNNIERRVKEIDETAATKNDAKRLESAVMKLQDQVSALPNGETLAGIRREMDLVVKATDRTEEAVVRIEQHLLKGK